jgi:hypothetical protein
VISGIPPPLEMGGVCAPAGASSSGLAGRVHTACLPPAKLPNEALLFGKVKASLVRVGACGRVRSQTVLTLRPLRRNIRYPRDALGANALQT